MDEYVTIREEPDLFDGYEMPKTIYVENLNVDKIFIDEEKLERLFQEWTEIPLEECTLI